MYHKIHGKLYNSVVFSASRVVRPSPSSNCKTFPSPPASSISCPSSWQPPSLRVCLFWTFPINGIYHMAFCVWLLSADVFKVPPACGTYQNIPFYGRIIYLIGFLKLSFQRSFSQTSVRQKDLAEERRFEHSFRFTRDPRLPPRRGARSDELLSKHFDSSFLLPT